MRNISFSATKEQVRARKWNLPLTYEPKIQPVIDGDCTQTIRACTVSKSKKTPGKIIRKKVGDLVRFYIWEGRPYWSKRRTITEYMPLVQIIPCRIFEDGLTRYWSDGREGACFGPWVAYNCLAARDGIIPPTGEALRDVLISKNGRIPDGGIEAQILRWERQENKQVVDVK
jgi:hypothetical protein